jgi:hypothetical protein
VQATRASRIAPERLYAGQVHVDYTTSQLRVAHSPSVAICNLAISHFPIPLCGIGSETNGQRTAVQRTAVQRTAVQRTAVQRTAVQRTAVQRTAVQRTGRRCGRHGMENRTQAANKTQRTHCSAPGQTHPTPPSFATFQSLTGLRWRVSYRLTEPDLVPLTSRWGEEGRKERERWWIGGRRERWSFGS